MSWCFKSSPGIIFHTMALDWSSLLFFATQSDWMIVIDTLSSLYFSIICSFVLSFIQQTCAEQRLACLLLEIGFQICPAPALGQWEKDTHTEAIVSLWSVQVFTHGSSKRSVEAMSLEGWTVGPQTQEKAIGRKKEVNSHTLKTIGMSVNKLGTRIAS